MNTQHRDILTAIGRKQPITTAGIAEYLMDHFGYGGGMEFDAFRDQVSKTIGYLKSRGLITGEDRPQTKGKPVRYWELANPQSDCQSAEMASDVAEVAYIPGSIDDPTINPDMFRSKPHESIVETRKSDAHENTDDASQVTAADAVSVSDPAKAEAGWAPEAIEHTREVLGIPIQARDEASTPKPASTIPVGEAIAEFASYRWGEKDSYLEGFLYGIAFAERYHNIFDAD